MKKLLAAIAAALVAVGDLNADTVTNTVVIVSNAVVRYRENYYTTNNLQKIETTVVYDATQEALDHADSVVSNASAYALQARGYRDIAGNHASTANQKAVESSGYASDAYDYMTEAKKIAGQLGNLSTALARASEYASDAESSADEASQSKEDAQSYSTSAKDYRDEAFAIASSMSTNSSRSIVYKKLGILNPYVYKVNTYPSSSAINFVATIEVDFSRPIAVNNYYDYPYFLETYPHANAENVKVRYVRKYYPSSGNPYFEIKYWIGVLGGYGNEHTFRNYVTDMSTKKLYDGQWMSRYSGSTGSIYTETVGAIKYITFDLDILNMEETKTDKIATTNYTESVYRKL